MFPFETVAETLPVVFILHDCYLLPFQHQYHTKIDDFLERVQVQMVKCIIEKLLSVLESVLAKLARYDEGTFFSSILSLTVSRGNSFSLFSSFNLGFTAFRIISLISRKMVRKIGEWEYPGFNWIIHKRKNWFVSHTTWRKLELAWRNLVIESVWQLVQRPLKWWVKVVCWVK